MIHWGRLLLGRDKGGSVNTNFGIIIRLLATFNRTTFIWDALRLIIRCSCVTV